MGRVAAGHLPWGPWAVLRLQIVEGRDGDAVVDFHGDRWYAQTAPFRVESLSPDPGPWLRAYLGDAEAALAEYRRLPPSSDVLLEIARLQLVLYQPGGIDQVVSKGLGLLKSVGTDGTDRERVRRLGDQLMAFGRKNAIAMIGSFLDEPHR